MGASDSLFDIIGELLTSVAGFILIAIIVIGGVIGLAMGGTVFGLSESKRKKAEANAAKPQTQGKTSTPVQSSNDQGKNILKGCLIAAIVGVVVIIVTIYWIMNALNSAFN